VHARHSACDICRICRIPMRHVSRPEKRRGASPKSERAQILRSETCCERSRHLSHLSHPMRHVRQAEKTTVAVPSRLQDGSGGDRVETAGLALPIRTFAGLAQVQEPGRPGRAARGGRGLGEAVTIKSHFKHNLFTVDEAGEILEHLGGIEDYLLAAELYEVAVKRWPTVRIQLRQESRIVYDSGRRPRA
jgi:hypothetical protein